jgi:uncharacterized membrane protein
MNMDEMKSWYMSKAVWGGLIAVAAGIAGAFGLTIGQEEQAQLVDIIVVLATSAGGLLAVIGRVKATKEVK